MESKFSKKNTQEKVKEKVITYCSKEQWKSRFPFVTWLPKYQKDWIISDVIAGLTVGLTVLPQGLAYANIAKLPIQYGLYSAALGGFIYCLLGMSRDITIGPTAIMSLLVSGYGVALADDPETNDPTYAILLAFFCGFIQIMMGIFHLGFVTNFISSVVISGFTSAAAITIGFGQLKNIFGVKMASESFFHDFKELIKVIKYTRKWDTLLGVSCMVVLAILRCCKQYSDRQTKNLQGTTMSTQKKVLLKIMWLFGTARNAVVVMLTCGIAYALKVNGMTTVFTLTGNMTAGIPPLRVPDFRAPNILEVLNSGIILIPLIGFLENVAIAKGFGRKGNYKVDSNQELIAVGACNLGGSFLSSYPITGSFSRSAINCQSGVRSPLAGIITGSLVLISLACLTPLFQYIPKASLAAVIIYSVIFMVDYKIVPNLWRVRKMDLVTLFTTFFLSLLLGVEYGTLIGIGVDLLILLGPISRPGAKTHKVGNVTVIQLERGLNYPALNKVENLLDEHVMFMGGVNSVIFDFTHVADTDYSVIEGLQNVLNDCKLLNVQVAFACVRQKVNIKLSRSNIPNYEKFMFKTVEDALNEFSDNDLVPEEDEEETVMGGDGDSDRYNKVPEKMVVEIET
ncbi:sodium-independent sulfate anion transporter-like [Anneissia japonica]|uniref:sodium-independent sulfate anion transporter-like n=1 Tax=Anneissia japonica TaxID=1529436 RepID=UPI0014256BD5|nr:sodium-independent sulfate anion transporter-like [Anneissia japonica]XP_033096310.1 sodium-independent sulfate anion transporter-like [Anneissia japonica]